MNGEIVYDVSWIERLSIVRMSVLFTLIYRFSAIPIRISASYFVYINKLILKFTWKGKTQNSPHNTEGQS